MKKDVRLHDGKRGAALAIHVIPRANQNEIVEIARDGSVKIRLDSPSAPESLNRTLVEFLSEVLSVEPARVEVVAGQNRNSKLVSVLDMSTQVAHERILQHLH